MSKHIRTIVKGIIWELLGLALILILTSDAKISVAYITLRIVMYWIYHRIWKKIRFGKK